MKIAFSFFMVTVVYLLTASFLLSQSPEKLARIDSLETALSNETDVELKLFIISDLKELLSFHNDEKVAFYESMLLELSKKLAPHKAYNSARLGLARIFQEGSKVDSSVIIVNSVLKDAVLINDIKSEWKSYMLLGNASDIKGDTEQAYSYFLKGFECHKRVSNEKDKNEVRIIFGNNLANNLGYRNRYEEALIYFKEALAAVENNIIAEPDIDNYKNMKGIIFNGIGTMYVNIGDKDKAIEYYLNSIEIRESIKNTYGKLFAVINLFDTYLKEENYNAIIDRSTKVLQEADSVKNSTLNIILNSLVINAELELDMLASSKKKLENLEQIVDKAEFNIDAVHAYDMARFLYYLKSKQYPKAESALLKAEKDAKKALRTNFQAIILSSKIELYSISNKSELLVSALDDYNKFVDDRLNENVDDLAEIEANFTNLENEKKVALLEKDKELISAVSSRNKLAAIGGGLLALLAFVFLYQTKKKNGIIESNNKQLSTLNNTKDQIFSIIGHDLKKPAIAFRGITEKLRYLIDSGDKERLVKYGESVEKDALELNNLTDNLLSWALLQKDLVTFKEEKIDLTNVSQEVVNLFSNVAKEKNIELSSNIRNVFVNSDKNALATVLRNLVDNALKYTGQNGSVIITAEKKNGKVELIIKDNGQGIEADRLPKLFALAKEKSTQGTSGEKGTGLGLHIVKDLVEKSKGTIDVDSVFGKGTTFRVALPIGL